MDKQGTAVARLAPHQRRSKFQTVLLAAGLVGISLFSIFHQPKQLGRTGEPPAKPADDHDPMNPWASVSARDVHSIGQI